MCVVYIPTYSLTTGTYFAWVNGSTLLIIYSHVPSQCEYTLVMLVSALPVEPMAARGRTPTLEDSRTTYVKLILNISMSYAFLYMYSYMHVNIATEK